MNVVAIHPVITRRDKKKFIRFQWKPYEGNPYWVPPLLMDRRKLIDQERNPFYKHAIMELFLAMHGNVVVGRIGAIINHNHNREHDDRVGFFGFFECVDDQEVANALFDRAKQWLLAHGATAMRGPASPSVNDEYGLLIQGFERSPAILMAYNPPYYQKLIENYGFKKAKDLYAYEVRDEKVFNEKLIRISEMAKKRNGVVFRTINMKEFDREAEIIRDLYNRGWARNWGQVPITDEEFDHVARDMKPVIDPHLVIVAELKGNPVGFGLSLPDLNIVLKHNKRGYLIPGLIRLLLFKKKINCTRIVILGVLPEYRNTGIGGVLFYETGRRSVERGYHFGEASWVLEDNVMMNRGAELMQAERTKTYRVYEMQIS